MSSNVIHASYPINQNQISEVFHVSGMQFIISYVTLITTKCLYYEIGFKITYVDDEDVSGGTRQTGSAGNSVTSVKTLTQRKKLLFHTISYEFNHLRRKHSFSKFP